jgi:hypothetical protein
LELSNDRSYSIDIDESNAWFKGKSVAFILMSSGAKKDALKMTTQALTQISYSNAYNTVLSTGVVAGTHPMHGWAQIGRAIAAQTVYPLRAWGLANRATRAQRKDAAVRARLLREAAAVRATQPGLADELVAFAMRDNNQ